MEINGKLYAVLFGSDIQRDGFFVEARDEGCPGDDELVIEIFHDDTTGSMTVTMYKANVPLEVVETLIGLAHERLPLLEPLSSEDEDASEAE